MGKEVYYSDYLALDKILDAQHPESEKNNIEAHDEMLFIIIHQAYELWFKQILHEITSVKSIFNKPRIQDNSPSLQIAVHRLNRVTEILRVLVDQINILETMTPLDFLDFRDLLKPASGFQSHQFKLIEAHLGLKLTNRHGKEYYKSALRNEFKEQIKKVEEEESIIELLDEWLCRMPFGADKYWEDFKKEHEQSDLHIFWNEYRSIYENSLLDAEMGNLARFDEIFFKREMDTPRHLSAKGCRSALFIMLYRDYPLLHLPFQYLNLLLDIDELMATWRYRHMNMVHRMIGTRIGTGGSTGKDYLHASLNKHYVFKEIAELTSFLIERRNIPKLGKKLVDHLGFERE